jgi:serine/threonine protein kinase
VFAGRYKIVELLGEGDRKRTYLASDLNLDRQVALALIKPEAAQSDPAGTKREVEVLGQPVAMTISLRYSTEEAQAALSTSSSNTCVAALCVTIWPPGEAILSPPTR